MHIFESSMHTHDAKSEICMNVIFKYNTCILKPYRHQTIRFIFRVIFSHIYTFDMKACPMKFVWCAL